MNLKNITFAVLATLISTVAIARDSQAVGEDVSKYLPKSGSRAEVLADLQVYRRSGLAEFDRGESQDFSSSAYIRARARYMALRASPDFKALVSKIARERGEELATAGTGSGAVVQ
jgi:hypothetical protein